MNKIGFFEDLPGSKSMGRLLSFFAFIVAGILALYGAVKGIDYSGIIGIFLGYSIGLKTGQKYAEVWETKGKDDSDAKSE